MRKKVVLFCTLLYCLLVSVATQAQTTSLNGTWAFRTDPANQGETQWFKPEYSTTNWDSLPVPGNWDLRNEYANYAGKGWYRRTFTSPGDAMGKVVRLVFEGVYHDCTVWLNGQKLGENHSGYLPFEFEVTDLLNKSGPNTLVVCTDNTFRRGAIWNWGGIRRPVTLVMTKPLRVVRQHITPTVDLTAKTATVAVRVFLQNHQNQPSEATGTVQLSVGPHSVGPRSAANGFRRSLPFRVSVPASTTASVVVRTQLTPAETHLWHFDDPFLYTSTVAISDSGSVTDRFGLRKIEVDNRNYAFKLNGESIRPMGFNLVPDDRTTGNTLPLWRIKEDIDRLKELGMNMARLTHLPLPKDALDYLDERGIMTFAEVPLWGFDQLADQTNPTATNWLDRMVERDFNHPCIIGWSVGNEIGHYPGAMGYVEAAIKRVRTLDPARLAVMVSHTAQRKPDPIQFSDVGLINKYGKSIGQLADQIHTLHPDKVLFYSEYGYGQLQESLDGEVDAKAMVDSIRNRPYLIGGSLWTFNDYRSSYVGTKEYSQNRPWGVVDVFRQPKKAYHAFRRELAPIRSLAVADLTTNGATVVLIPRRQLDLPAYTLTGYRLVWKVLDQRGTFMRGGVMNLPVITPGRSTGAVDSPGNAAVRLPIRWTTSASPADSAGESTLGAIQIALVSPLAYAVYDTTLTFSKPQPPAVLSATGGRAEQNDVRPNSGTIRVTFSPGRMATAHKVRYGIGSLTNETPPTLNPYADIAKLTFDETYQVAVVSINPAGESEPTTPQSVKVEQDAYAPPIVQYTEPADGGFFVGYATAVDDYLFQVQYTQKSGDYAGASVLQSDTKGVLFVPNLSNGQPYFFRLRRLKDNNYPTAWSEERTITPDGGQRPPAPVMQGVIRQPTEAVICFEPVKKAMGYVLHYRPATRSAAADAITSGDWMSISVSTAHSGYFILSGLDKTKAYQFQLSTRNATGQSDFSPVLTTQPDAKIRRNR